MPPTRSSSLHRILPRVGLAVALAAVGQLVLLPTAASAASNLTVSTTADIAANAGSCGNSNTTPPSPLSLREATCIANNLGGAVNINIPAGTYNLTNGEIAPGIAAGSNISLIGAGSGSTTISAGGASRVIDLDKNLTGGVSTTISGLTITGGADSTFGGAGIIGGSGNSGTADSLSLNNVIITGNAANGANMTVSNKGGGGVQFYGGQLSITNSTISNNTSGSSYGSGVAYGAQGAASPEGLTVTNTTFSGNATANTHGDTGTADGGALAVFGSGAGATYNVTNSRFVNNTSTSASGSGPAYGGAIWSQSGNLTVTETTFTGNSTSGGASPNGGAVEVTTGTGTLHYNRFTGNISPSGSAVHSAVSVDAAENWFGCNAGPGSAGCDTVAGTVGVTPRLVLAAIATPATVVGPNATSTVSASLVTDSAGGTVSGSNLDAFDSLPATFSDPPGDSTVTLSSGSHTAAFGTGAGHADIDYHSGTVTGPNPVNVTFDNQTVTVSPTVNQPPAITSPNTAHFNIGQAGSFTVTTTGYPNPAITQTGTLPTGLTFHDNGDGTATISGTPSGGGGTFPLSLTANNGVTPNATQTLTLTVGQPPAFTSGSTATFVIGQTNSFTVTTSGIPTVSTITETGTLPAGVTFTDNGNGTATIAGTPTGTGNTYPVTLTATNGVSPNATQNLTIQVNQAPAVTSNPSDQTVQPGTSVSFSASASGVPTPTVQWQRSTDGGGSFANISGATSATYTFTAALGDDGNEYRAVFSNGVGSPATTTAATLHVGTAPAFTSADHAAFAVGVAGTFAVTTSGMPSATLSHLLTGFPGWLTLNDFGDGSGTLTGTPPAGSAGQYTFTLKAANGFSPSASQTFTLSVDQSPTITSPNHATFTVGTAGSFAVTTTAGFPTTTGITETGTLPSGVTFTDNGDGTATLAGSPAVGSAGVYPLTIRATATGGITAPTTQSFTLTVNGPPTITSADHATFAVGTAGSFTVNTTAGYPVARTVTETGTLPSGVTFTDNGNGTGTLAGTPNAGSGGVYPITFTASNGISPDATQSFTLTVNQPPVITSPNHDTFTVGTSEAFTVTTAPGQPTATTITETGTLPAGITFTDNGNGTATIGGTPTAGGTFALTIKASNGIAPDSTQSFTLTVNQPPAITSADHVTFTVGTAGSFTVMTTAGTPAARTITETGSLPTGVTFTDNGDGTATLAGTPAAGQGGSYPLTIRASNGVAPIPTQSFTLTVLEPTAINSADHVTFQLGTASSFSVTTIGGFPTPPVLTETGALPAGVTFTDNGDGTATLAGTPTAGGSFPLTITANNGVAPNATQAFTLTVNQSPAITSPDHATFTVGTAGSFTVTTNAGTPSTTTLTEAGALPAGVTFTDNGDGTATLAGTPAAGSGKTYSLTFTASNGVLPNPTQSFTLTVLEPTAINSADHVTFQLGTAGTFSVTTIGGFPTPPVLTETGALPAGVTFTDNGDGTATLAGTPTAGGSFPLTITANNGVLPNATQAFTLTVNQSPVISSPDHATFAVGTAGSFTVTTTAGTPSTTTLTEAGTLPAGVTFTDNGDGTATLAGTPAAGQGGSYSLTFTASNGVLPDATQSFTLTVTELPHITSPGTVTFSVGTAGSFTVHSTAGFPAATTLTETGALPAGVTFTDNGDGTATLAGTPAAGSGGAYPLTLTATNSVGHTDQAFVLTVDESPSITSGDATTFTAGTPDSFTVQTAGGFPTPPTVTETGTLPAGVTFTDNGDGTATLAGTATAGGVYPLTITASNGASTDATQSFTLTVNGPPTITSADTMTFTAGVDGTFTVTTRAGVPAPVTLTETGTLPFKVTFVDNHDGTATLSGKVPPSRIGSYPLTITASNGVAPDATQSFTLKVVRAHPLALPGSVPNTSGLLHGVPLVSVAGTVLHVSGDGFAAGAPITIGVYSTPTALGTATATATGSFTATIRIPAALRGGHTFVAAGVGANGASRYLEARSVVVTPPGNGNGSGNGNGNGSGTGNGNGSGDSGSGGGLANTGPDTDPRTTAGFALAAVLAGLMLLVASRRRRRGEI